jgi:type II secretory pathway component PulF
MTDERESGLHIDVTISVGYRRLRNNTIDRWEARVGTLGLLVVGAVVVVILLVLVLPRVLDVFGRG